MLYLLVFFVALIIFLNNKSIFVFNFVALINFSKNLSNIVFFIFLSSFPGNRFNDLDICFFPI